MSLSLGKQHTSSSWLVQTSCMLSLNTPPAHFTAPMKWKTKHNCQPTKPKHKQDFKVSRSGRKTGFSTTIFSFMASVEQLKKNKLHLNILLLTNITNVSTQKIEWPHREQNKLFTFYFFRIGPDREQLLGSKLKPCWNYTETMPKLYWNYSLQANWNYSLEANCLGRSIVCTNLLQLVAFT